LGAGRVQRLPWTAPSPPELAIAVEVRRFEKTSDNRVELEAQWTIADVRGKTERMRRQTRLSLPAGKSTQAAVASLSQALATLSQEIAGGVQRLAATVAR